MPYKDPVKRAQYSYAWTRLFNQEHPEIARKCQQKWRAKNPERVREISRASKNRYKDRDAIKNREHVSEWKKKYPERARAQNARRKAYKLCATPAWADQEAIDAIYADAVRVGLTVDHIVPLKSPIVCGLHVPWNLRLLSEAENNKKGNRWVW